MVSGWWILKINTTSIHLELRKRFDFQRLLSINPTICIKYSNFCGFFSWISFQNLQNLNRRTKKKTVQLTPSSSKWMLSTVRPAGRDTVTKYALDPKEFWSDHNNALANDRPRTSKLQSEKEEKKTWQKRKFIWKWLLKYQSNVKQNLNKHFQVYWKWDKT